MWASISKDECVTVSDTQIVAPDDNKLFGALHINSKKMSGYRKMTVKKSITSPEVNHSKKLYYQVTSIEEYDYQT